MAPRSPYGSATARYTLALRRATMPRLSSPRREPLRSGSARPATRSSTCRPRCWAFLPYRCRCSRSTTCRWGCRSPVLSVRTPRCSRWRPQSAICWAQGLRFPQFLPDWRVEPQPQQVTTRVFRRVAVVESGPCMQDRVVVDEIRFARLKREFEHKFRPVCHRLERVNDGALCRAHRPSGRCLTCLDIGADIARRHLAFDIRIHRDAIRRVRQFAWLLLAAPVADIAPVE